jgi:hypothetical protein
MSPPVTERAYALSRRALLLAGALATLPACAPSEPAGHALTRLARDLLPHPILADTVYRAVADAWRATAPAGLDVLLAALDAPGPFAAEAEPERHRRIAALVGTAPFMAFRFHCIAGLYGDHRVTSRFGYGGPSLEAGGWIERGYDDLAWLPEPTR